MLRTLRRRVERWPLARPFRISRGLKTEAELVIVELSQGDVRGWGEAAPYARYGENGDSVCAQISAVATAIEAGATREQLLRLMPAGAARNAIDCALWDLEMRLGGAHPEPPAAPVLTAMTVSIDTPEVMGKAAADAAAGGARLIKVKLDAHVPGERLKAIRAAAPDAQLIVDANEGWSLEDLLQLQPLLRDLRIAFVEQPLPAGEDERLDGLAFEVPLCADESCHTSEDLDRLAGRYALVNVKLDKAGGLTEALTLIEQARARGFGVMTGCMVCTSLGVAPAFHIAALSDFVDVDGPLWMSKDRPGGVHMRADGLLAPPKPVLWGGMGE